MTNYKVQYPDTAKPFPDENWKHHNKVWYQKSIPHDWIWKWLDEEGRIAFITYRFLQEKSIVPIIFGSDETDKEFSGFKYRGNWQAWNFMLPIYNLPAVLNNPKKKIAFFEGEKTAEVAQGHLPDMICTTTKGGSKSFNLSDPRPLYGREIILFPDNDNAGFGFANKVGHHLKNNGCVVKMVKLPDEFPPKWDYADPLPEGTHHTYQSLVSLAEDYTDPIYFNSLEEDAKKKRYIIIEDSNGKQFYDKYQRRVLHKDYINLVYKNDPNHPKGLATNIIAEKGPERIRSTAFKRIAKDIIEIEGDKYLNTFHPVKFPKLTKEQINEIPARIQVWINHLKMIFNQSQVVTDYFESTIAHDIQKPNYNRTWAWLLHSSQGLGKGVIFEVIKKLNGVKNCAHVTNEMLTDRYRAYLRFTDMIFCTEVRITGRDHSQKADKLKELISEDTHPIEEKFVNTTYHQGHYKVYLSSNDPVPIKLETTDRRISLNSTLATKAEILEEDPKYFDRIWAFIRDDYNIACLHYYYSKIYKISEAFNPHEPLDTIAKRNLLNAGRGQIYLDLDAALNKPHSTIGRAFQFDFINIRRALEEIREAENEKVSASEGSYERIFKGLTEYHLQQWLMKINAKPIKNNQPVSLQGSGRKRWWAIRNQEYWQQVEDLQLLRDHLEGKHTAPTGLFEFKQKREKEAL